MKNNNHCSWIVLGDEWIISYLVNAEPTNLRTVSNFSIAHALECYLKSAYEFKFGRDEVMKVNHSLFNMFNTLQNEDKLFLPFINLNRQLFDKYSIMSGTRANLDHSEEVILMEYDYLYFVLKYVSDLKYHRFKKASGTKSYAVHFPEMRFTKIFNAIRMYVGFNESRRVDFLKKAIEEEKIINFTNNYGCENFLKEVIG